MKRIIIFLLSAAFLAAPSFYALGQSVCRLKPTTTVLLYPQGQEVDLGLPETQGPKVSNGITEPEWSKKGGGIGNISDSARVDIYLPKKGNGQMVIVCPGGGYNYVSALNEGVYVAEWMNSKGVAVAVVKYRMPNGHWEVPLTDIHNTFRYCRAHAAEWGVSQIGVMGFSAGGHLAASASTMYVDSTTRPDFSILVYPVTTLDRKFTHQGTRNRLLGADEMWDNRDRKVDEYEQAQKLHKELIEYYSLPNHVNADTPPTYIVHCTDDKTVPIENALRYYTKLVDFKVSVEMHVFPSGGHGWGFSSEEWKGKGKDKFAYARDEFYTSLERWMNSLILE